MAKVSPNLIEHIEFLLFLFRNKTIKMNTTELNDIIYKIIKSRLNGSPQFYTMCNIESIYNLLERAQEIFSEEPTVLRLKGDIVVVGDIHGNIDDLLRIFELKGYPPASRYLFLGDYIDRGSYSMEVVAMLLALKVKYPEHIFMIRGNHEIERISSVYGFYAELSTKYTSKLYGEMNNMFYELPICAVVGDKVFCVHGGIGPNIKKISEIEEMPKPEDVAGDNAFVDMLWSDPRIMDETDEDEYFIQSKRGSGYYFGEKALDGFLEVNNLSYMIRSHELCQNGYSHPYHNEKCITIFSNTDYCMRRNSAAIAYLDDDCKPKIMTLPYLRESARAILKFVLPIWIIDDQIIEAKKQICSPFEDESSSDSENEECLDHSIFSGSLPDLSECSEPKNWSMVYSSIS